MLKACTEKRKLHMHECIHMSFEFLCDQSIYNIVTMIMLDSAV